MADASNRPDRRRLRPKRTGRPRAKPQAAGWDDRKLWDWLVSLDEQPQRARLRQTGRGA